MQKLLFADIQIISYSDQTTPVRDGAILSGAQVSLAFDRPPKLYYRHGWQSWSLTAWHAPDFPLRVQMPAILHPLQTDPLYARHPAPNGSWVGAVRFEDGKVLLLGALGLEAHVALHGQELHGWYEAGSGEWFVAYGDEPAVFASYASLLGERLGPAPEKPAPRVWCSWYSFYKTINEPLLHRVIEGMGDLPFDVLQVDDGWQASIGDWRPNEKFPSGMEALAAKIRASGRTPGLWLAPLLVVASSEVFRQHPGWLLRDPDGRLVSAGFNWGEPLYALDSSHPEVLDWLRALMKQVRGWGFDYLKLDFLYAGALPGVRQGNVPRETALRQSLQAMRDGMGTEAYFLACGAPILPCLGVCDALRVGPDVAGEWESRLHAILLSNPTTPGTRNAIRTTLNRLWLRPLVATDPDVVYFGRQQNTLSAPQKRLLQDLALICDFRATSDLPWWLEDEEREGLRAFLEAQPQVERTGRTTFELDGRAVDFEAALSLPDSPSGLDILKSLLVSWAGNQAWVLRLMDRLGRRNMAKMKWGL